MRRGETLSALMHANTQRESWVSKKVWHLGEAELEALRAHGLERAEHVKDAAQRPLIFAHLQYGMPFCTHAACPGLAPAADASERAQQTKQVVA